METLLQKHTSTALTSAKSYKKWLIPYTVALYYCGALNKCQETVCVSCLGDQ